MNRHDVVIKTSSTFPRPSFPPSLCGDGSAEPPAFGAGKLCMLELFFCEGEMLQLVWFAIMLSFVTILRSKEMSGIFLVKKKKKKSEVQERIQQRMLVCFTSERRKTNHTLQCPHPQSKTIFICTQGFYKSPSLFWKFIAKQPSKFLRRGKKNLL